MKRFFLLVSAVTFNVLSMSAQYNLEFNESAFLSIPDPPNNGVIARANWTKSDPNITIKDGDESGAIVYPNHYFENTVMVSCDYRYEYYKNGKNQTGTGVKSYVISFNSNNATLNKKELSLKIGQSDRLTYTFEKSYSSAYGSPKMTWESSDDYVATVDKNGKVTAVGSGHATITFDPVVGPPVYCSVSVERIPPTSITIEEKEVSVVEGDTKALKYTLSPDGASADITWRSSDESVAEVNKYGRVKGNRAGVVTITAETDNHLSATCKVEVLPLPTSVSLSGNVNVRAGYALKLTPTCSPSNAVTTFTWESDNPIVASVDENGNVRGKKDGTAKITVSTKNKKTASTQVRVSESAEGIDYRNAGVRTKALKNVINESINLVK